jgi:hypothetical protein
MVDLLLLKGREMFLPSLPEERASESMGAQEEGNGLSLESLAQRLETQTHRLETLELENSELRSKVATLEGSQMPPGDAEKPARALLDGRVSRRRLLSKAGVAAVGLVVAGALTQRDIREAKAAQLSGTGSFPFNGAVVGLNTNATGYGVAGNGPAVGVYGESSGSQSSGVRGISTFGNGVRGESSSGNGVYGTSSSGHAIFGEGSATATEEVAGVRGIGKTGVWGSTGVLGHSGVYGQHTGSAGFGLVGDGTGSTGAGVLGRDPTGPGIEGRSSKYGGKFAGSQAQLMLVPKGTVGKPSGAHTKGEISMDSAGTLFVCTANGTPGTWRKVTTTAA